MPLREDEQPRWERDTERLPIPMPPNEAVSQGPVEDGRYLIGGRDSSATWDHSRLGVYVRKKPTHGFNGDFILVEDDVRFQGRVFSLSTVYSTESRTSSSRRRRAG